jgi:hypothetical protein
MNTKVKEMREKDNGTPAWPRVRRQYRIVYSSLHLGLGTDIWSGYLLTSVTLYFHSLHPLHPFSR